MIGFSRNLATVLLGWALFVMTSYTWAQEPEAVLYLPQITEPQEKEILHIGVVASDTSEIQEGLLQPTLKRLHEKLPRYRFEISTLDEFEIYLSAVNKVVDRPIWQPTKVPASEIRSMRLGHWWWPARMISV